MKVVSPAGINPSFAPMRMGPLPNASYAVQRVQADNPQLHPNEIFHRLWYSTFVNLRRKYLYYEVPKAASTSIKLFIHEFEKLPPIEPFTGAAREVRPDMFIHTRQQFQLGSLTDFDDKTQEYILNSPEFFRFTVVRNPYTRLQSAWSDKVQTCAPGFHDLYLRIKGRLPRGHDPHSLIKFPEFVEAVTKEDLTICDPHWRIQVKHLFLKSMNFNFIGRVELLGEALRIFGDRAGFDDVKISSAKNPSQGNGRYDQALADHVYKLYELDFIDLGYSRDSWSSMQASECTKPRTVSEARFLDEITQRNIVISRLYSERAQLLKYVRRLEALCGGTNPKDHTSSF